MAGQRARRDRWTAARIAVLVGIGLGAGGAPPSTRASPVEAPGGAATRVSSGEERPAPAPSRVRAKSKEGAIWEVQLILDDGRKQVFRGVREASRERQVLRLRVDAANSDPRPRRSSDVPVSDGGDDRRAVASARAAGTSACLVPVERIEGGFVAPKPARCEPAGSR